MLYMKVVGKSHDEVCVDFCACFVGFLGFASPFYLGHFQIILTFFLKESLGVHPLI